MILPTEKVKAKLEDPSTLLLYGKPKIGKTTILATLPNCLIIDLEEGTNYVDALAVRINSLLQLKELAGEIVKAKYPYKYLAIDTVSALEDLVLPYADELYKNTPMGANWKKTDVRTLPNGAGYFYLRQAFFNTINNLKKLAPHLIFIGHLKETLINKDGEELSAYEVDLTGKIRSILSSQVDAIGYIYRKENQNVINFNPSEEVVCGNRITHIEGKHIVISEKVDGVINTNWNLIYKNLENE
jgi:energy-coupling factor transporter ATP-binding protein EcfA2